MLKKYYLRVFIILAISTLISNSTLFAQSEQTISDSTSFKKIIENSFEELGESNYDDDVQRKYAQIFYNHYLNHANGKYSEWALVTAFKFWGNIGAADKVDKAMAQLDYDAESWRHIIAYVPNAYVNSEDKTIENAVALLEGLTDKLTHPKSKSGVYWWLASYYHGQNNVEKLKSAARAMINLDAIETHVNMGLGYLYEIESLNIGQEAPHFQVKTVQGEFISLPQNDKIILLEFWATWCGPCMPEIPHLKSIQKKYSDNNLQIIGISLDKNLERLKQFIRERNITWPQIIQTKEWNGEIVNLYNVSGIPRTYIIGKDGKIIAKDLRGEELEKEIAKLMKQEGTAH